MKLKKIAAVISAAAAVLALAGCNNDADDPFANYPQNAQTSGANSNSFESKPEIITPAVQMPDIPVNEATAFEYHYDSGLEGMVITDYKLQSPKVHIPEKLENEKVVKVDFYEVDKEITHIIMPDSVKYFYFSSKTLKSLQFFNLPDSLEGISESAFSDRTDITSVTIPDKVIWIDRYAFYGCTGLTSVTIPDSVTTIHESAFKNCTGLKSMTIGNNVTAIYENAFMGCTNLTNVNFPDSIHIVGNNIFDDCKKIQVTYKGLTYDYDHIADLYSDIESNFTSQPRV